MLLTGILLAPASSWVTIESRVRPAAMDSCEMPKLHADDLLSTFTAQRHEWQVKRLL